MKTKVILGLSLLCAFTKIVAVGEIAFYQQAILLDNKDLAESIWLKIDKKNDPKVIKLFTDKFKVEPKATGGELTEDKLPTAFSKKDATTADKFQDLFGKGNYAYGRKVMEKIKQEGGNPEKVLDTVKAEVK